MLRRLGSVLVLVVGVLVVGGPPASAAPISCGSVITQSVTLTADVGPCNQGGLVIGADGITVDLAGHTVFGKARSGDGFGIVAVDRTGVTVRNGRVRLFDTGISIRRGGGNTVDSVTARDNIGTFKANSKFGKGDGIELYLSSNNSVINDVVVNNGPFSGIVVLGDKSAPSVTSAGNLISNNVVVDNDVAHDGVNEDDGIRLEGPNVVDTVITGNTVRDNGLDGIAVFADQGLGYPNTYTSIVGNTVEGNGFHDKGHRKGDGIVLFGSPTSTTVQGADFSFVRDNVVRANAAHGIRVASRDNVVSANTATGNAAYPGVVSTFDLTDANQSPPCDNNSWSGNSYGTANLPCIS